MENEKKSVEQDLVEVDFLIELRNHLDEQQRLKSWPSKGKLKNLAITYLAKKFEIKIEYTEKEVNDLLNLHHTFRDPALLRRELYEQGFLKRTLDCKKYWKVR